VTTDPDTFDDVFADTSQLIPEIVPLRHGLKAVYLTRRLVNIQAARTATDTAAMSTDTRPARL
jgi:hypothetical protein